ncbi:MAG: hypothetical protein ACRD50_12650 [Candidatus Acidiferrales bacterium]
MSTQRNEYHCGIELNQNGKYEVRIQAFYGRRNWVLRTYFLASTFDGAIKKLEQSLQMLQRREDQLWFWGKERSDDPNVAGEMLAGLGLKLDRRAELSRRTAELRIAPERRITAFHLTSLKRALAGCISSGRLAAASD